MASETTPLIAEEKEQQERTAPTNDRRHALYDFLEARTPLGLWYENGIILLIILNVLAFIFGTLFVDEYNDFDAKSVCGNVCDALWFGNYEDNGLGYLGFGTTSVLELVTIFVFTIEYLLRLYTADIENEAYKGCVGRLRYIPTFYSVVDLLSTVPFFVDWLILKDSDLASSAFIRQFRLLRITSNDGRRFESTKTMISDVWNNIKAMMGTALFVGVTIWLTVSSLYYIVERKSVDMIYCGAAPDYCDDDIDTEKCVIDAWGVTDCGKAGCPSTEEIPEPCYNLFQSIPMASYYSLLNCFGEFPLVDQHNVGGKIIGTFTAILAVAFFALPTGIVGNGFETAIEERRQKAVLEENEVPIREYTVLTPISDTFQPSTTTLRGQLYCFLHALTTPKAVSFDNFINILIILTVFTFMLDTVNGTPPWLAMTFDTIEFIAVVVFTVEYFLRLYSIKEDPKYQTAFGRWMYVTTFLAVVDLLSFLPYYIEIIWIHPGQIIKSYSDTGSTTSNIVSALRLLRIFRFEKYTHAFLSFDDIVRRNLDVLQVTAFTAILLWIFFSAFLYLTERDNPDEDMASNYNNMPNSMWITLLNLSGESPLAQYSVTGKVITGLLALFATGVFGIPIGILGAGFETVIEEEQEDTPDEQESSAADQTPRQTSDGAPLGTAVEQKAYNFVNGQSSKASIVFELFIYLLIMLSIAVAAIQTIDGQENTFHQVEWFSVIVFTIEYIIRLVGAGADPEFVGGDGNPWYCRLRYIMSFYSIVDLLAIVPFYIAYILPSSFINDYDEYLRMFRILRLVKLDKYVPSITLIDDVIRLKYNALRVAVYAALTLSILFAALLFAFEHEDVNQDIDPVPLYGCFDDQCTEQDRFQNFFDSFIYTTIHLTGDYPITEYSWPSRILNFFIVVCAVGVVSIPSSLVASGFEEILEQHRANKKKQEQGGDEEVAAEKNIVGGVVVQAGDDWYDIKYKQLKGVDPPPSKCGPMMDRWQTAVNELLNGKKTTYKDREGIKREITHFSTMGKLGRVSIFTIIILNIVAVVVESIPTIDRYIGNEPGNFFDVFEEFSVFVFAIEYILRLFCAPKSREALYSSFVYATTFFGIVDFLSTAPWFIEQFLIALGVISPEDDAARIFRIVRIFRILQLEDFFVAFSKLDNVIRASKDVFKATGLLACIIWVGCGALFYIFEENNPNWRSCDPSIPLHNVVSEDTNGDYIPGCYDFKSTRECNEYYSEIEDACVQNSFTNMPNSLYYTAVFLVGEWGVVDFTWPGRIVCIFLCVMGIALYAIPVGTLFDSFASIIGLADEDDEEDEED